MLTIGVGNAWGVVLFHETFGNNTGSARAWSDTYSVKSGVSAVYSGITGYTVSNCKQGKNTTGSTQSGLNQTTQGTDAYIIIGPLSVASYSSLNVTYQWKAASIKGSYTTKLYYATSSGGSYTEVAGTGTGATSFVERSYLLPVAAQVSTLYLKIVWNTSNTQAIIDEVELTGTAAASCDKKVTIVKGTPETGGSFNLDKTGAQDCCSALTVTVSNITAPSGKEFDAITQSGIATGVTINQSAKTVTYAANSTGTSTINVTFRDLPKYTVTLMDDGDTRTQASYGANVTLPSRTGCTGYTFAGWTKTWVASQSSWTTTAPTIIPAGNYTPTANENLYPVYTKTEGGGSSTASSESISSTSTSAVTLETGKPITYTCSESNTYSNPARIYKNKSITIAGGTITSISLTGVSDYAISNMTANTGTLTTDGDNGTWTGSASSITFTASTAQTRISAISVTYSGGSTTYYISVPDCCIPLGSINGSISLTQLATPNPTKLKASWTMNSTTGLADNGLIVKVYRESDDALVHTSSALAKNTTDYTITGLSPCTSYYATLTTVRANSTYCEGVEDGLSDPFSTTGYTYTINKTNVSLKGGETEAANSCDDFGAIYVADAGYDLPATITVTNAGAEGTGWFWDDSDGSLMIDKAYVTGNVTVTITGTAQSYFPNNKTIFIQAESSSAWDASACVKAWFNNSGAGGSAESTHWLFDATGTDAGKKLFATVVPADGDLNQVTLQRFSSDCSEHWNNNGTLTKASDGGSNTFRTTGSGNSNVAWNANGVTLSLYGSPNSWASSLGTFTDQGGGVWVANYTNYAPTTTSDAFKISTNYNGWIGDGGSNDNAPLNGMTVGSTYNVTATLEIEDHSLTMTKTFVKGTVHFDLQGHGSAIADMENVAANATISAPAAPSATGWDFGGWYKEPACTNAWNFASDVVTETMTLYAKWTKHTYTISSTLTNVTSSPAISDSYEYTGSAAGLSYTLTAAAGYSLPATVTVSGTTYTWDQATGVLTLTGTIASDVSITVAALPTVTWMAGGSVFATQSGVAGTSLTNPGTPSNSTYCDGVKVFVGWTGTQIVGETDTQPADLFTSAEATSKTIPASGTTYYAVFATMSGSETEKTITINTDTLTSYASVNKTIGGMTFKSTDSWGKTTWKTYEYLQCKKSSSLYNDEAFPGYIKSVTITRQPSGEYDSSISGAVSLCVGTSKQPSATCEESVTSYDGVTFNYSALNNYTYLLFKTGTSAATLSSISITYMKNSYTYSAYATRCSERYDIVLHDNNGGSHNGSAKVRADGTTLTNIAAPTRDGYSVEGYYKEAGTTTKIADASGVLQADVTGYTDAGGAWTKGAGATLYTKWTATNYTITYDGLEGASNSNPTNYTIETATITLANPGSREGYTFGGWTCGGSPITQIAVGSTGDKTITATWTANTYSVRFNANGGGGSMSPQNFTYGVAQNLTSNGFTAPSEKSFGGWATSAANANANPAVVAYTNGQNVNNLSSANGAIVDLYAVWVDCELYTVTLKVNGDTWKTVTQGSCGASIDLSSYQDVPNCDDAKYTFVGWSETNPGNTTNPTVTKTSSYTPESDVTLYAVYSYSAKMGTLVKSTTGFGGVSKTYIIAASGYNSAMGEVATGTVDGVAISKDGDNCVKTGSGELAEFYFEDAGSDKWFVYQPYIDSEDNYGYIYFKAPTGTGGKFNWYNDLDYTEWYIDDDNIKPYGYYDYDYIQTYMKSHATDALWSLSINGTTGVATLTAVDGGSNTRYWQYNSSAGKFSTYKDGGQKIIALYEYTDATAYTTQPSMTVYSITKGAETNGTYTISAGVVCSGGSVSVTATPNPGYAFNGWSSSNGGSFGDASSASTTYTIGSSNTTLTASFVAAAPHDITWMVNGSTYTVGDPTGSLTAGTSFSTMTLPTAPANNTLSSACGAVANQFVGWSTTDMGFATGQSAPAKLFTNAAGAGTAYGLMGDADVTFYAVFAQDGSSNYMSRCADTYSITLDKKEGTTDGTAVATEMGSTLDITFAPTYAGHSVEGYYAETGRTTKIANADGSLIANKSGYTDGSGKWINTTSPLTLYTNWALNSHTLTWDLNGGSISAAGTPAGTIAYGTELVAPTVTKTGYTFNTWSPAVDATMPDNDVTYTATWTAKQYAITYKDKDDAAYSGDKTDGRPTGCPANHTYGSATDLPYGVKAGYRFDGWFTTSACTGDPITSIASDAEGPFTLYAKWTASHTFTFSKNGVVDGTLTLGQVEGGNVIMPNTTVDCGLWTTFEGWVIGDVAETTTEPTTIYKPGDIFVAGNSNQEFKAVYSKHEGDASVYYEKVTSGPKSGEYVLVSSEVSGTKYTYTGQNTGSGSTDYGTVTPVTESDGVVTAANLPSGAKAITVRAGRGTFAGKFAMQIPSTKYLSATNGNYLNSDISDVTNAFVWKLDNGTDSYGKSGSEKTGTAGAIRSATNTTRVIQYSSSRFACYEHTQSNYVFLYRKRVAGTTYYATAPSCVVPTEIAVSYNDNKANAGDQTIEGTPSGTTIEFTTYPNFASYSIGAAPTDPTGYHFTGWNTSADGSGDAYAAGASVTTFGYIENITLYAQWERVYTVTLMDNGVERTRLTQESAGANVPLPSGNNCGVGSAFTFVGWTDSPVQLNAEPVRPNIVSGAGEWGDDELTDDITLYSVYSKSVAGCDDFEAGMSGAYKLTDKASGEYALAAGGTSSSYARGSSGDAEIFYIGYSPAKSAYTIRTSIGYLGWFGASGSEALTKGNATPYYWNITAGTGANTDYWYFEPVGISGRQFSGNSGSKFQVHGNSTKYYIQLTKMTMAYYYNTAICEGAQITFHDGGGAISGTPTTPDGASWNSGTHVLSGLEDCDKITEFPTANYDGWTFVGWSTEDYSNSGKHVADYAEENASTDEPDASIIYKTGGNPYVVRGGSIDLYPVFTRFPENEPFDMENGGEYYMYYLDESSDDGYGAPQRRYAGEYEGTKRYKSTTRCAEATTFVFTKDGDRWHIQNKASKKYIGGNAGDDWLIETASLGTLTEWTITIRNGNQFNASCQSGRQIIVYENFFMDYASVNLANNPGYHCVYLGSCEERIYSSEPSPVPTIDLTGNLTVTSAAGQRIRATEPMKLSGAHLAGATQITLSGTNLSFATSSTAVPVATLNVPVSLSGSVAETDIYVYYTPTETEDGTNNLLVTATDNGTVPAVAKNAVQVRHLPADFVIAAKIGDKWYALPADINSSSANTTGVLIEVDNVGDPTAATAAPMNTKWGLRNVKTTRQTTNGLGDYLTFTEQETAEADNRKTLYNGSGTSIQTNAQWTNYAATNPEKYEWIPTTADFKDYTLTNASAARTLSLGTGGVFGSLSEAKAYGGQVRLLPATFFEPAEIQVIEWKTSAVVVMYTGSGVTATTQVGTNSEGSAQTLTAKKIDHGVFELTTTQALNTNTNKTLAITIRNGSSAVVGKKMLTIPAIVSGSSTSPMGLAADVTTATDVVVLDGATLSAAATKYTFKNITVYPGGKLVIGSGKQLGMSSLTLRGGSSWGAAEYEYKYPQFVLNNTASGAYTNSSAVINYDYVTTKDQYYSFVLPYDGSTATIKYPVDIYGSAVSASNTGSFEFQYYDGAARATGATGWKVLAEPATLVAGTGYTFLGMPKKVDAYDGSDSEHANARQRYGIHRIPMSVAANAVQSGETADKNITIAVALATKNNDSGWNLIGNPFMSTLSGLSSEDIQVGKLIHSDTSPWDGKWRWDPETMTANQRFVVIPGNDGLTYESEQASTATLPAFKNFFVQIQNEAATAISFPSTGRTDKNLAPARYKEEAEKDIMLAVDLVSEARKDKVDLLINDIYSAAFDQNGDFTKMMNTTKFNLYGVYPDDYLSFIAVDKTTAANSIAVGFQVPSGGDYSLQLSDRAYVMADAVEALYVTDHEVSPEVTTDLLDGAYTFHVNNAETNNTRFTLSIRLAPETPTDIGNVPDDGVGTDNAKPQKFIYHDKLYILRNGVIYDATGKQVKGGLK